MMLFLTRRFALLLLAAAGFLAIPGCSADPTENDVVRVKQQFLILRFRSGLDPKMQGKSDMELFQQSCINNRVNCDRVVEMLKQSDPEFHSKLTGE